MSLDFTVFCNHSAPWLADSDLADGFPFGYSYGDLSEYERQGHLSAEVRRRLEEQSYSCVLHFSCRGMASEYTRGCIEALLESVGGFWTVDVDPTPSEPFTPRQDIQSKSELLARWRRWIDRLDDEERQSQDAARQRFLDAAASDPAAYAEANDWSDVL